MNALVELWSRPESDLTDKEPTEMEEPKMNPEDAAVIMQSFQANTDQEGAHYDADGLLCLIAREAGFGDAVDAYMEIDKWYA